MSRMGARPALRIPIAVAVAAALFLSPAARATDLWLTLPEPPPMPAAATTGMAPVNDIRMYYAIYGAGPPVLMIHGGLADADIWASQVADLMKDHQVIVADSRGQGRSTAGTQPFGFDLMASDYLALLDYLKLTKVDLVGWSDGAIIGLDIAMNHPERLGRLFAQGANVTVDGVRLSVLYNPVFATFFQRAEADYRRLSPTPDGFAALVKRMGRMWESEPDWSDDMLRKITVPTAIVLGDHDEAIKRPHTDHIAAVIPGAREIILKDVGHFAMLQDPAGYTQAIRAFLK